MKSFSARLLHWWERHGRHDLPWQQARTAYRVWLAEVMLQQTQVATVIPYYQRFLERFPNLIDLASANEDEVLALWSGLGYYSRGRNLHRTAQLCQERHGGMLPDDPDMLAQLPGIGPSTANAIVAQAHDRVLPILDGNVKRVMARHAAIAGWPGQSATIKSLWQAAIERLPKNRGADYTQAIMDLGATLCTPRNPDCAHCPVAADCMALQRGLTTELPARKPRKALPHRQAVFILLTTGGDEFYLQRRPAQGIWASLWCLPEFTDTDAARQWLAQSCGLNWRDSDEKPLWARFDHTFTHFKLHGEVWRIELEHTAVEPTTVAETSAQWLKREQALAMGLPQPIRALLQGMANPDLFAMTS